jgi:hypothetical protein
MKNLSDLKQYLRETAFSIKTNKPIVKAGPRGTSYEEIRSFWEFVHKISNERVAFRHHLIAYCELRKMPREKIEKPAENNKPNESWIEAIKKDHEPVWRVYENVHTGA